MQELVVNTHRFNGSICDGRIIRSMLREELENTFIDIIDDIDDIEILDDMLRGLQKLGAKKITKYLAKHTDYVPLTPEELEQIEMEKKKYFENLSTEFNEDDDLLTLLAKRKKRRMEQK